MPGHNPRILDEIRNDSELGRWADNGLLIEPSHSNIIEVVSPAEQRKVVVEVDDPVEGYLVRLEWDSPNSLDFPDDHIMSTVTVGNAIVEDSGLATDLAHEFAEHAERYDTLSTERGGVDDTPSRGDDNE